MLRLFLAPVSRRGFLRDALLALVMAGGGFLWWRHRGPADLRGTLDALVESLAPPSADTAMRASMAQAIVDSLADGRAEAALMRDGLAWFELRARERFGQVVAGLGPAARDALLEEAATAGPDRAEGACFARLRHAVLGAAFADPAAQEALAYGGPPLPAGYPDYADPPRRT